MDFVTDTLQNNRKFRVLNVIDDCDRVAVAQKVAPSRPTGRVIRFLEEIIWEKGKPANIRCDNGPEFVSHKFRDWCRGNGINILYTQPGCPTQNAYIERFNRTFRREWLEMNDFRSIEEAQELATEWLWSYNHERPHSAIGGIPPAKLLARMSVSTERAP